MAKKRDDNDVFLKIPNQPGDDETVELLRKEKWASCSHRDTDKREKRE